MTWWCSWLYWISSIYLSIAWVTALSPGYNDPTISFSSSSSSIRPDLVIIKPPNDLILDQTELHAKVHVHRELPNGKRPSRVCIIIQPEYAPIEVDLESEEIEMEESCFNQSLNHAAFHITGLEPGFSYSITAKLEIHDNTVALSSRIFSVGSILLPSGEGRVSIADALETGSKLHNAWDRGNASQIFRYVLDIFPDHGQANHLMGALLCQDGKKQQALPYLYRAVQLNESDENFHNSLGLCLKSLGRKKEAIEHYRRALELNPMQVEASVNLGDVMQAMGKWKEAMDEYSKVAMAPMNVLKRLMGLEKAENVVKNAMGKRCELIRVTDGWHQANHCLEEALERWPGEPTFHNDRGNILANAGQFEEAFDEYEHSFDLGLLAGTLHLAETLEALGETQQSIDFYDQILDNEIVDRFYPRTRIMVMKATVLPRILPSTQKEIDSYRSRFDENVKVLLQNIDLLEETEVDPNRVSLSTAITLTAHNRNNRKLKAAMGCLYWQLWYQRQIMREEFVSSYGIVPLPYTQRSENIKTPEVGSRRLRVGFVSRYIFNSAVGLYMSELIPMFNRERYEIIVFAIGLSKSMKVVNKVEAITETIVGLPKDVRVAREEIRAWNMDVLIYPELGMDKTTYFVSLARLAPIQAVWWGNADTSGVPTMDYYLTSEFEHSSVNSHYSEVVYCFKGMGIYHKLLAFPRNSTSCDQIRLALEEVFDIPADFHLYLAIESIIHIHPDFDVAVASIFEKDEKAHLFLLSTSSRKVWESQLQARMESAGVNIDRLHFLTDADPMQESMLLQAADAVLASLHLTRPRASLQAFAVGAPVVTFPNELWASRITYGFYQQMGVNDLIATSLDEYVGLAIKLASDAAFHKKMRQLIEQNRSKLSQDKQAIKEWEHFFDFAARQISARDDQPTNVSLPSCACDPFQGLKGFVDWSQVNGVEGWSQVCKC
ncbi:unnamed protein product [Peronospora belbahrii]|uniref:protein O-GlcNAc transferase n=1 Tax=Peronospora belbahrii TaxID=622444 RepID=A0AAU9L1I0_9STRA|nr:unnamed protein product [Peronospora belbahrii]CAH0517204.1 unnamed protein product [Peronospora belbahrii]